MISQLKIAELKQLAERPDVVEVWDVTSPDPQMLVFLKVGGQEERHVCACVCVRVCLCECMCVCVCAC